MKIKRNKIIEATEAELMEHYLKEGYDDIYSKITEMNDSVPSIAAVADLVV